MPLSSFAGSGLRVGLSSFVGVGLGMGVGSFVGVGLRGGICSLVGVGFRMGFRVGFSSWGCCGFGVGLSCCGCCGLRMSSITFLGTGLLASCSPFVELVSFISLSGVWMRGPELGLACGLNVPPPLHVSEPL